MYSARDIAEWFVAWADEIDDDEGITQMKLQKLLYYAKGLYMRKYSGALLFDDSMEAWAHGPVVPSLWRDTRQYKSSSIPPDDFVADNFDWDNYADVNDFLVGLWETYGRYTAFALRNKTHKEDPWRDSFYSDSDPKVITDSQLLDFFSREEK